jgi:hypothetical protein
MSGPVGLGESAEQARPLSGSWDVHVHSSPDLVPRMYSDAELVAASAAAGMAGLVIKNHHFPTTDRAIIAQAAAPQSFRVLGGVVLNRGTTGGLNPAAVQNNLRLGARVVWLPTLSARHHLEYIAAGRANDHLRNLTTSSAPVELFDRGGGFLPALDEVLSLVAEADAVLASGHLAPDETCLVFDRAREIGVQRLLVTHAEAGLTAMPVPVQVDLARRGVKIERCYLTVMAHDTLAGLVQTIRQVGLDSTILATDLGQVGNPDPITGLARFQQLLAEAGLTGEELRRISCDNHLDLLGL